MSSLASSLGLRAPKSLPVQFSSKDAYLKDPPLRTRQRFLLVLAFTALVSFLVGSLLSLVFGPGLHENALLAGMRQLSSAMSHRAKLSYWSALKSRKIPGLQENVAVRDPTVSLCPMPSSASHGQTVLAISPKLEIIPTDLDKFPEILKSAVDRYRDIIFERRQELPLTPLGFSEDQILRVLELRILGSGEDTLAIGVDESYSLFVPFEDSPGALLQANTVFGLLRGLETFSQLCSFDYGRNGVVVAQAPWVVKDKPRFPHRGLHIDTARHFQPVAFLERIIDAMAYSKLNVLHWHMVDQQSFPIQIPSFPDLWKGALSKHERYTVGDIAHVVKWAADRGIVVMPEIDVPGHSEAWGVGLPELWPSQDCKMPLDVSRNSTFDVIRGILRDLKAVVPFKTIHLGGDEVTWTCWETVPSVAEWMKQRGFSAIDAYRYFVLRAVEIAKEEGWETVVLWEETFDHFGESLDKSRVIMESWFKVGLRPKALAAGMRVLMSQVWDWYLDGLDVDWYKSYVLEPCRDLPEELCKGFVGGEACMWAEHVDPGNIMGRIWPRAAAVAERLWSPVEYTNAVSKDDAQERILAFKCRLHRRGIGSSPITIPYKQESQPASCYNT